MIDKIVTQAIDEQSLDLYQLMEKSESKSNEIIDISRIKETLNNDFIVLQKLSTAISRIMIFKSQFRNQRNNPLELKLIKQIAYEQELYSKTYGLKGKVDSV